MDAVGVGKGVLANARHLPGNFHVGFVGADCELVMADLGNDDGLQKLPDHGQANGVATELLPRMPQGVRGGSAVIFQHVVPKK